MIGRQAFDGARYPWAKRFALAATVAVALGYAPQGLLTGPNEEIRALEEELEDTRRAIGVAARENQRMRERARALREDPRAIEEVARRDLGWVRAGEVVVDLERAGEVAEGSE